MLGIAAVFARGVKAGTDGKKCWLLSMETSWPPPNGKKFKWLRRSDSCRFTAAARRRHNSIAKVALIAHVRLV